MKKLNYLLILLCLIVGITACGNSGELKEYVNSEKLEEQLKGYVDTEKLEEQFQKYTDQDAIKDFVQNEVLDRFFQKEQQKIVVPEGEMGTGPHHRVRCCSRSSWSCR